MHQKKTGAENKNCKNYDEQICICEQQNTCTKCENSQDCAVDFTT